MTYINYNPDTNMLYVSNGSLWSRAWLVDNKVRKEWYKDQHLPISAALMESMDIDDINKIEYICAKAMPKPKQLYNTGQNLSSLSKQLPGVNEHVKHPVDGTIGTLWYIIQNLNDSHKWTRNRIADWIETLDIDTEFKEPRNEVI